MLLYFQEVYRDRDLSNSTYYLFRYDRDIHYCQTFRKRVEKNTYYTSRYDYIQVVEFHINISFGTGSTAFPIRTAVSS